MLLACQSGIDPAATGRLACHEMGSGRAPRRVSHMTNLNPDQFLRVLHRGQNLRDGTHHFPQYTESACSISPSACLSHFRKEIQKLGQRAIQGMNRATRDSHTSCAQSN